MYAYSINKQFEDPLVDKALSLQACLKKTLH